MREKDINLEVTGMGMILYSDHAVVKIKKGDNFFADSYSTVEDVLKEVNSGKIVGILSREEATVQKIGLLMGGIKEEEAR